MSENSERRIFSRKSIRLKGYDYRLPGAYFVTICTENMRKLFGSIVAGEMILNRFGIIAREELLKLQKTYPNLEIFNDEFVIMPNHIHTIFWITDVGATEPVAQNPEHRIIPSSLGAIIGQYKSRVTKSINKQRRTPGRQVWQRNYYDRIIRNNKELLTIKKYINDNPDQWEEDSGVEAPTFT